MELRKLSRSSDDIPLLEKLNNEAFPDNERVPIPVMFSFSEKNGMDILGIYVNGEFSGFFIIRKLEKCAYIAYFAVCPEKRSKGIGGCALKMLSKYYSGCQIVVDFEAPDENSGNNAQRLRRRAFYYRNGFFPTGYYQYYMDTEFEIACSDKVFNKPAFEAMIADIHEKAPEFDPHLYQK